MNQCFLNHILALVGDDVAFMYVFGGVTGGVTGGGSISGPAHNFLYGAAPQHSLPIIHRLHISVPMR